MLTTHTKTQKIVLKLDENAEDAVVDTETHKTRRKTFKGINSINQFVA